MTKSIILDVDTGIDDAMAIMFAVRHPDIDIKAISCVSGNTALENVLANTCKVLDVVSAPDVPVAGGALRPLLEDPRDASYVHGPDGMGNLGLPPSGRRISRLHAVELMRQVLSDSPEPLTLVALAPLTNVALLLRMHPHAAEKIERIVFMGGSASVGNASAVAEFNIWHDPEAAKIVLNAGLPLSMYGLDVFNIVAVDEPMIARLVHSDNPVVHVLGGLLGFRSERPEVGDNDAFRLIGDAGAVCLLVAPELMHVESCPLQVELSGFARGQTIVDRRAHAGGDTIRGAAVPWPTADVVLGADVPAVVRLFLETLGE